jgi:hypothetical protein
MRIIAAFAKFWYHFIVGDDWRVAVGVVIALAFTYTLSATTTIPSWWVLPAAVLILLPASLWQVARRNRAKSPSSDTSAR